MDKKDVGETLAAFFAAVVFALLVFAAMVACVISGGT